MSGDIVDFCNKICSVEGAIKFLRNKGVLRSIPPTCPDSKCNRVMTEVKNTSYKLDGIVWRCAKHKGKKMSIRIGSLLENSNLSLRSFTLIVYFWSLSIPITTQVVLTDLSKDTLIRWNLYFRDTCSKWLLDNPIQLGGPGVIVQIDESLVAKRKYHRGRVVAERWVFGLYDTTKNIGVLQFVEKRDRNTLIPIIEKIVLPGTEIHSDSWKAYMGVIESIPIIPPYVHKTVNHTQNFVDPATGAHTNHVECFWKNIKSKIKQMCGTTPDMLSTYLDEFMWRQLHGKKTLDVFDNFLKLISINPVNLPNV